jgi:hypothetical protein
MVPPRLETRTAELLDVLDADIRHLEGTLSYLNTLRTLLIRRADPGLAQLLDDIRQQGQMREENEQKRQRLRRELAADLGCREGDLTLSRLQDEWAGREMGAALRQRQDRLRSLTGQLKREHALTVLLLRDCARLNRSLLRVFLGSGGRGGTMYNPTGVEAHQAAPALMSLKM